VLLNFPQKAWGSLNSALLCKPPRHTSLIINNQERAMFRQDLVMRMIEQFGLIWTRYVRQFQANMFPAARTSIDQAYREVLGLEPDEARILGASDLLARMQFEMTPDLAYQRASILAALLNAEANLALEQSDPDLAASFQIKALSLLLSVRVQQPQHAPVEHAPEPEQLIDALEDYELPPQINQQLIAYYELQGAYAKAEDRLFELSDQLENDAELAALGEAFYERLLSYPEVQLHAGDFSRREAKDGLKAWRRTLASS
jgi:hypothetical protein